MMIETIESRLPKPNPRCVVAIAPLEVVAAYVASQKESRCTKPHALKALSELINAEQAIEAAIGQGRITERNGVLLAVQEAADFAGAAASRGWGERKRALALRALGAPPSGMNGKKAKRDLAAIALRQLYGLDGLSAAPSRAEVRCELLRRILASLGDPFAAAVSRTPKAFKFDAMSRGVYLSFAGLASGSFLQADAALLSSSLDGPARTVSELSATIIRAAVREAEVQVQLRETAFDLDSFARSIRELASRLETKPYAGRVAIAQVYDSGIEEGLDLGTLDHFKERLASAAREGLLDLERYDITGPLEPSLKERSRLRLGRDERHFIVNQWM